MDTRKKISKNLVIIQKHIVEAAQRAHRDPSSIRLVAVSKGQPSKAIDEALAFGQFIFGENYLQEAIKKITTIGDGPIWHFIGHLQSNKAKQVAQFFNVVETVHNFKLATILNRCASELDKCLTVLIQVNLGVKDQKNGCSPAEALVLAQEIVAKLPALHLKGLMTIPPYGKSPEVMRSIFASLRKLATSIALKLPSDNMNELSMGMSHDYQLAIEEGATIVRIGTAIFGARTSYKTG